MTQSGLFAALDTEKELVRLVRLYAIQDVTDQRPVV